MNEHGSVQPPSTTDNEAALARARAGLYRFISAAFAKPPTPEVVGRLADPAFQELLERCFDEGIVNELRQGVAAGPNPVAALRQQFMDLFKVPAARYVQPYESVYRDSREINGKMVKGLLMGPSAQAVQKWYRLAAREISEDFKDLPDHVALEFHFLAELCEEEAGFHEAGQPDKARRAREMQRDFLKGHILSWVPRLAKAIHEAADGGYYPAVADLAVAFSRQELAALEAELGPAIASETPAYKD
ncbi:MAG: hypothetical protein D6766_10780 [Verrucomicrobia bacterium]|nr:MAG: hypothetical protein D6766_10780 [Verrucomicrobiota bacterium]